jgi:hypothetical protein
LFRPSRRRHAPPFPFIFRKKIPGLLIAFTDEALDIPRQRAKHLTPFRFRSPFYSMAAATPLGFGIIGLGIIADFHAQAIAQIAGATLVWVATRNATKARAFAEKHHVPFVTTEIADLVARPDIQVICITTPSAAHLEASLAAIRAGKHVVIEKPIEVTSTMARLRSTRRAWECALFFWLNSTVSSNTVFPGLTRDGIDLNNPQVHS